MNADNKSDMKSNNSIHPNLPYKELGFDINIDCPTCGWKNVKGSKCPNCDCDLSPIIAIHLLPDAYIKKGKIATYNGNSDVAIETLAAAIALNPEKIDYYVELADIYIENNMYKQAIALLQRARKPDIDHTEIDTKIEEIRKMGLAYETQLKNRSIIRTIKIAFITALPLIIGSLILIYAIKNSEIASKKVPLIKNINSQIKQIGIFQSSAINIDTTEKSIILSGQVPSNLHKSVLKNILSGNFPDKTININGLIVLNDGNKISEKQKQVLIQYRIRKGENLSIIASKFYGSHYVWQKIYDFNKTNLESPDRIYVGQTINIPMESEICN